MITPKLLPDIEEFLASNSSDDPVSPKGLDELIYRIRSCTGLNLNACKVVTALCFQEMRTQILNGKSIYFEKIGKIKLNSRNIPYIKQNNLIKGKLNGDHRRRS
jgi:hypothetical protein